MNNVSAMAQIKEEDDSNLNDAKYTNQPVDLEHLSRLTKSKEKTMIARVDEVEDF